MRISKRGLHKTFKQTRHFPNSMTYDHTTLRSYLGRHSTIRGCAGVHSNNHIPNCRRLNLATLRPGDSQRQPLPVPPSETVDVRATHPSVVLLHHDEPSLQLTTPLPASVRRRHRIDEVTDDCASVMTNSMSEPSEPALQKR